jgi:hypothetical protein
MELSMLKSMLVSAAAIVAFGGTALVASAPAQAQVGLEIGPGGVRAYESRPYRPVVERRERRRVVIEEDDDAEVCRTEVRRRYRGDGSVVTRRVRICE